MLAGQIIGRDLSESRPPREKKGLVLYRLPSEYNKTYISFWKSAIGIRNTKNIDCITFAIGMLNNKTLVVYLSIGIIIRHIGFITFAIGITATEEASTKSKSGDAG